MYSFKIKADASDINVPAVRSLLVFAVIIIAISRNTNNYTVNIIACILLIAAAFATEVILVKYRLHPLIVTGIAAVLLATCTLNIIFPVVLLAITFVIIYFYITPVVEVEEKGIRLKKTFSNKLYPWSSFNNIVLKDNLLTLDFRNNKLLQLELSAGTEIKEEQFNSFCTGRIGQ